MSCTPQAIAKSLPLPSLLHRHCTKRSEGDAVFCDILVEAITARGAMLTRGGHIFNIATKTLFSTFSVIVGVRFSLMNWAARGPFTNVTSTINLFKHKMPNPNALPAQRARATTWKCCAG